MPRISYVGPPPSAWYAREIHTKGTFGLAGSNVLPGAGWVIYSPLEVRKMVTVDGIYIYVGGTGAGQVYVALYDVDANDLPQNRLAVSADTLVAGANRTQYIPFTASVQIRPEVYYCAIESDGNTDTFAYSTATDRYWLGDVGGGNAIVWWRESLGAYAVPPAVATPVALVTYLRTTLMTLRVSSIP